MDHHRAFHGHDEAGNAPGVDAHEATLKLLVGNTAAEVRGIIQEDMRARFMFHSVYREAAVTASGDALWDLTSSNAVPEFLSVDALPWSDMMSLQGRAPSAVGVLPDLARVWLAIDNHVFLWNYETLDCVSVDIDEPVVGLELITPKAGVFHPRVARLLCVTTPQTVQLLAVRLEDELAPQTTDIDVTKLGPHFITAVPSTVVKVRQHAHTLRTFCIAMDGCLYELEYYDSASLLRRDRMRVVNKSIYFGGTAVAASIGKMVAQASQTWRGAKPPLQDIAVDQENGTVYTLDEAGSIEMWAVTEKDLYLSSRLAHTTSTLRNVLYDAGLATPPPLVSIHTASANDNFSLMAIAQNGDRFLYDTVAGTVMGGLRLSVQARLPAAEAVTNLNRTVKTALYSDGVTAASLGTDASSDGTPAGDQAAFVTLTNALIPSEPTTSRTREKREVLSVVHPPADIQCSSIEGIAEVSQPGSMFGPSTPNELCSQLTHPARRFFVLHQYGISSHVKARPVDVVHMLLLSSNEATVAPLLQKAQAIYGTEDLCCMLMQLAGGAGESHAVASPENATRRLSYSSPCRGQNLMAVQQLGVKLTSPVGHDIARQALELLKNFCTPHVQERQNTATSVAPSRVIQVQMSPMVAALKKLFARAVHLMWETPMLSASCPAPADRDAVWLQAQVVFRHQLAQTQGALCMVLRVLEHLREERYMDSSAAMRAFNTTWTDTDAEIRFPHTAMHLNFSRHDAIVLQATMLQSVATLVDNALQVTKFVEYVREFDVELIAGAVQDANIPNLTLGELAVQRESAAALARAVMRAVVTAERSASVPQQAYLSRVTSVLESECRYMFSSADGMEYRSRLQLDHVARSIGTDASRAPGAGAAAAADVVDNLRPTASQLWSTGALLGVMSQLEQLGCERGGIELYLHAAAQMDPAQSTLPLYHSEDGGDGTIPNTLQTASHLYHQKTKCVRELLAMLEHLWLSNRVVFDGLFGTPSRPVGTVWGIEPSDELTHCLMLDWLSATRDSDAVNQHFSTLLVHAASPFLEAHLLRCRYKIPLHLALYYRLRKKDCAGALEQYLELAKSPLQHIHLEDRLAYRLRCLNEAVQCAIEGGVTADVEPVEKQLQQAEAQRRLLRIVEAFLDSGSPFLDDAVGERGPDGKQLTQRDKAEQHRQELLGGVFTPETLYQLAAEYKNLNGGEVQLRVLQIHRIADPTLYAEVLTGLMALCDATNVEARAVAILREFYNTVSFPLQHVVRLVDAFVYEEHPEGSVATLEALRKARIPLETIFAAYRDIFEGAESSQLGTHMLGGEVSPAFVLYAEAHTVLHMATECASAHQSVGAVLAAHAVACDHLSRLEHQEDAAARLGADEHKALNGARIALEQCEKYLGATSLTTHDMGRPPAIMGHGMHGGGGYNQSGLAQTPRVTGFGGI